MLKLSEKRKKLLSLILGNSVRTISEHNTQSRLYIDFFNFFTDEELEEFINSKTIDKLEKLRNLTTEEFEAFKKDVKYYKELLRCNTKFKINTFVGSGFLKPLMQKVIEEFKKTKNITLENAKSEIIKIVENTSLPILSHPNHKELIINFLEEYLSSEEILELL